MKSHTLLGVRAELAFRLRLLEKGYYLCFVPGLGDVGVDCVVLTTKGWRGIQVKTAERDWSRGGGAEEAVGGGECSGRAGLAAAVGGGE